MQYMDIPIASRPIFDRLPEDKKQHVYMAYQGAKKDSTTALILSIFGLSLIYVGKVGLWIAFLFTAAGCGIWGIIEIINAKKRADQCNVDTINKLIMQVG